MDFVEVSPPDPLSFIVLIISLALFGAGVTIAIRGEKPWSIILASVIAISGFFGSIISVASFFGAMSITNFPLNNQDLEVGDQISEAYGLELSRDELGDLDYPTEKPDTDFEVFGSVAMDEPEEDGFLRTEVFLIWRDGEMALAGSPDGETFTELQR